jgi:CheY-like chemotaxis protein
MKKFILVVDDEYEVGQALATILEDEGFEVDVANDGQEAKLMLEKKRPDLILSDVMMPRMNGIQLVSFLKENPEKKNIPIVLMSAAPIKENTQSDGFLKKPFNIDVLMSEVMKFTKSGK